MFSIGQKAISYKDKYCKLLYFRQYKFSSNCEKRQFRQFVNSSFQDYQNIVCHRVNFLKNMCLAHMTDMFICLALV